MTVMSRRTAITLLAGAGVSPSFHAAFAKDAADRKFIFVILRGGMDGLSALIPSSSDIEALRGDISPAEQERLPVGADFALHPSFSGLHALYRSGEAAFIHAAATPYRDRSHFDGQDALETLAGPDARDGWLNRALQASGAGDGLAIGYAVPLVLKGDAPATHWSPPVFAEASEDLLDRLGDLYAGDPAFAASLATARATDSPDIEMNGPRGPGGRAATILKAAGELMAADAGPGVGVVSIDGWDTHANQAPALTNRFRALDQGLLALKDALGDQWRKTAVVLASEFGRTVRVNGTEGTDHGTGGLVVLSGGAVAGGRTLGDWPGLKPRDLLDNRDLRPVNDMAAILKGVLRDHLGLDRATLDQDVLPNSEPALNGLIRA
ncbi:MAG: DUF1501 domain-containing protein [Pseudomonadota bacterium]